MKYKTKLFLAFSSLVFISVSIALLIVYNESYHLLINQIRSQLLSIAVTSASSINGDLIQQINSRSEENTAAYKKIVDNLRSIRNNNRRPDVYIQNVYIMKPKPGTSHFMFVADAEENPELIAHYGDLFPTIEEFYQAPTKPFVEKTFTPDLWGTWISAFAPIYNSQGEVVASIGVDMSVHIISKKLEKLLIIGVVALIGSLLISLIIANWLAALVTNSLNHLCAVVGEIGDGNLRARAHLDTKDEFDDLSLAINSMAKGLEERERLKMGFARYVSSYILEKILKSEAPTKLEGERRKVTIFFSDIRHFTSISEKLPPEKVVGLLNEYFEKMIEVIFAYQGTLDKFLGDGIMVEFGAPLEDDLQEVHAIYAAINMQKEIQKLSIKWVLEGNPEITVGMGIHTGMAVVGNIGSEIRTEYTAVGDAVNVASRLERSTKTFNRSIIISQDCYEKIKHLPNIKFEDLGELALLGREKLIKAYAVQFDPTLSFELNEKTLTPLQNR